jgi:hypothetical protein
VIIAVDFDGTMHTGVFPEIGSVAPYAAEIIRKLRADGHYVILWSCRSGSELLNAINWCLEREIYFDRINDNCPANKRQYGGDTRKIYADLYLDDKQVGGLPTWPEIYEIIQNNNNGKTETGAKLREACNGYQQHI